jgi:A-factor type gamma-butyrolactone 1'-reductase (1S-forming)
VSDDQLLTLEADVAVPQDVERMVCQTVETFGRLDVAHNNAGVPGPHLPLWEYSEEDFTRVLAVDLVGVWAGSPSPRRLPAQSSGWLRRRRPM